MKIQRSTCHPSNFRKGRPLNLRPEAIVLHTAMASINGLRMQCNDPNSSTSAHYGVDTNGDVWQFVEETDTAFHAGVIDRPNWKLLREGTNPNFYTLGVSFTGSQVEEWTDGQYASGAALIAQIAERWGIPADAEHVIAHRKIRFSKACPGDKADIGRLIGAAGAVVPPPSVVFRVGQVTTLGTANLRAGAPSTSAPLATKLAPASRVEVAGFTTGEKVQGNANWYLDGAGNFLWAGATDAPNPESLTDITTDESELTSPPPPAEPVVQIDRSTFALPRGQYLDEVTRKDLIVLHFTAGGSARSAFNTWAGTPDRVATAYLVDTDGRVYETFDPSRWAFHLGLKETHRHDKRSIGIEIANVGPLRISGSDPNVLNWWPPDQKYLTKYCTLGEMGKYVRGSYRNFDFYAAFPEAQLNSVIGLVHHLCEKFGIQKVIPPESKRSQFDLAFFDSFQGVATHANFRQDKFDIGPAFDWSRLGF